jgi:lipoate-protein ligase A
VELIARAGRWLDETIADGQPRAGWSRATDAAIVLGSGQRLDGFVPPPPYGLTRRGTGGGAVICDAEYLMLDVTLPAGDARLLDDVTQSYRWLADALVAALGVPGVRAVAPDEVRAQDERARAAGRVACWAGVGPFELVDAQGRKLVGLAQRRRRGGTLFQAAAYLDGSRERLADLLPVPDGLREDLRARLRRVATLREAAPALAGAPPAVWA